MRLKRWASVRGVSSTPRLLPIANEAANDPGHRAAEHLTHQPEKERDETRQGEQKGWRAYADEQLEHLKTKKRAEQLQKELLERDIELQKVVSALPGYPSMGTVVEYAQDVARQCEQLQKERDAALKTAERAFAEVLRLGKDAEEALRRIADDHWLYPDELRLIARHALAQPPSVTIEAEKLADDPATRYAIHRLDEIINALNPAEDTPEALAAAVGTVGRQLVDLRARIEDSEAEIRRTAGRALEDALSYIDAAIDILIEGNEDV